MKKFLVGVMVAMFIVCGAISASAITLTFDDMTPITSTASIENGYGGFSWTNMGYTNTSHYSGYENGYINGLVSGDYVAYNRWEHTGFVYEEGGFTFNGAYLTAAWNTGLNITVTGYNGGLQDSDILYSETIVVDTTSPTWFDFNYEGIDYLSLKSFGGIGAGYSGGGVHFAMDNFTFNEPINAAPVPEPCTMLLLGTGLAGMGYLKRKRAKK